MISKLFIIYFNILVECLLYVVYFNLHIIYKHYVRKSNTKTNRRQIQMDIFSINAK